MGTESISPRPNRRIQEELVPRKTRSNRGESEENSRTEERISRRRGRGRRPEKDPTQSPPPASIPSNETPTPVTTTPQAPSEARSLAERYVAQYETQSGNTLTSEQRTAKVQEVESFYESQARSGRLDKIVFA